MNDQQTPSPGEFTAHRAVDGPDRTQELGRRAAGLLKGGEIVLLYGPLGAGKTCFVQGLCAELGVAEQVVSPTFTLVNTYRGRLTVHHLDFYRVEPGDDLDDIGVPDILDEVWEDRAVALVEWPEPLLPRLTGSPLVEILGTPGPGPADRVWSVRVTSGADPAWLGLFPDGQPRSAAGTGGRPC